MSLKAMFVGVCLLCASAAPAQKPDLLLSAVRQQYNRIQSLRDLRVVSLDAEDFLSNNPDNGASLKGYFRGDTLLKIVEWIGLSDRVRQTEYYLQNGKLLFVYACENRYALSASGDGIDPTRFASGTCSRFYYDRGRLFRQTGDKVSSANFHESLRTYAKLLLARR
ncbi:MAG: hypothetical protein EOO08_13765 [Chitinophagaceae bacterium]|nr:MAG: hypothetical protein EOO08_13765 [Chitinophagaceae bacterium]